MEKSYEMPDKNVSMERMYAYGYDYVDMLPLKKERALELFDIPSAPTIYCLYGDNTESEAVSREEIANFKGLFGVERSAWESFAEENNAYDIADCPRMAGDYEITNSFPIGKTEIVIGVNENAKAGEKFLVADCEKNELFEKFANAMVSDEYAEIVQLFGERIASEAKAVSKEYEDIEATARSVVTADMCYSNDYKLCIADKIVAINPKALKYEYQNATHQIYLVNGGFGAEANSRGSAVFCTNIYNGSKTRFDRCDILGVIKPECIPTWANEKIAQMSESKELEEDMER